MPALPIAASAKAFTKRYFPQDTPPVKSVRTERVTQNDQICLLELISARILTAVQNQQLGGYRAIAITSGIHAARLALQGMSEPSDSAFPV